MRVFVAPSIADDSWLMEPRFDEFRARYAYAATQTQAIPGLAAMTPEEALHVWLALGRASLPTKEEA